MEIINGAVLDVVVRFLIVSITVASVERAIKAKYESIDHKSYWRHSVLAALYAGFTLVVIPTETGIISI